MKYYILLRALGILGFLFLTSFKLLSQSQTIRDLGIHIGIFNPGLKNAIVDVPGVAVGHVTLIQGDSVRTGVTAILPHQGNIFQEKVPAAIYIGNGFGKLAGYSQVEELGNLETPIILTNTLSVPAAMEGIIKYTIAQKNNEDVRSVNAIVGETNDGRLNDIRGMHIRPEDVILAIRKASTGNILQGNVGAGTGTVCFGYKGGIGTSSRVLPSALGGYIIGVMVQTNFGGVLEIAGAPIGKELNRYPFQSAIQSGDGSCMIVVMTNAPLDARNLKRLAKRAMLGFAKTGGMSSNGSGDYVVAVSTAQEMRYPYSSEAPYYESYVLRNENMSPLFQATIEATEEAILNSLFMAEDMVGNRGNIVAKINLSEVLPILKKYNVVK